MSRVAATLRGEERRRFPCNSVNCLNPSCAGKRAKAMGLCSACHSRALELIEEGKTTWDQLEAKGKAKRSKFRRSANDRTAWLLT